MDDETNPIDIDELRASHIKLHGLTGVDEVHTFYYDETNNVRRLYLRGDRLNAGDPKVFVLGGVVHEGAPKPIDLAPLRQRLRVQPNADELKFHHVAKGDFLSVLKSRRLRVFLEWIQENDFHIHYHDLDPFFWSTVDIIDSILFELQAPELIAYHQLLKSDLAEAMKAGMAETLRLFSKYGYPGLKASDRRPFIDGIISIVSKHSNVLHPQNASILLRVLSEGRNLPALEFIEGFQPKTLIDDFSLFYLGRLALFKYSNHILDNESVIQQAFRSAPLYSSGEAMQHYRFADSKSEPGIQISDVVVGLFGRMHSFFRETPERDVRGARENLCETQIANIRLIKKAIDDAHSANIAFLHHVISQYEAQKLTTFLR